MITDVSGAINVKLGWITFKVEFLGGKRVIFTTCLEKQNEIILYLQSIHEEKCSEELVEGWLLQQGFKNQAEQHEQI